MAVCGEQSVNVILGTMTFGNQTSRGEAAEQLSYFLSRSHRMVDTARMYCHGLTEEILGDVCHDLSTGIDLSLISFASKANPFPEYNKSLSPDSLCDQSDAILAALKVDCLDIFYLHAPDVTTPIEDTLAALQRLYVQKRFKYFGLSNYAAWEVVYIHGYCAARGWITPSVYQGMYNAITRDVERELFPALRKLGMQFFAYNPLCGGMLTGKHTMSCPELSDGTRFDMSNVMYRGRYWKDEYFRAVGIVAAACEPHNLAVADCSMRWMMHHSSLSGGDGVIVGASSIGHLKSNLASCESGALPDSIVAAFDEAWEITRPVCAKYFRP